MRKIITLLVCLLAINVSEATHIRCGHISLVRVSGLTYRITLNVYTNLGSEVKFGDGVLDFGDGSKPHITPTVENTKRPDLGPSAGSLIYSIDHTFPAISDYTITYEEANLDAGIINVSNSVETRFYLESNISLDLGSPSSSLEFLTEPNFRHQIGQEFAFSAAAVDDNDYLLTYELANPLKPGSTNFSWPVNINVNYYNGLVTWDTNYKGTSLAGEYLFAVRVTQYNDAGKRVGYVVRSFQVILEDSNSQLNITNPITDINGKIVVENNKKKVIRALVDITSQESVWEVFYDKKINANFSFAQYDSTSGLNKIRVALLRLNTTSDIVRNHPYPITLRAKSLASNHSSTDINYLFFTTDVELPLITGAKEQTQNEIEIYPNPFSDILNVKFNSDNYVSELDILNSAGQLLIRAQVRREETIVTSHLPAGLYILLIRNGFNVVHKKVIKK